MATKDADMRAMVVWQRRTGFDLMMMMTTMMMTKVEDKKKNMCHISSACSCFGDPLQKPDLNDNKVHQSVVKAELFFSFFS